MADKKLFTYRKWFSDEQLELFSCVRTWRYPTDWIDGTLIKHKYLFDYYSWHEHYDHISDSDRVNREIVWAFKNSARKENTVEKHEAAENIAISFVVNVLKQSFRELVSKLTFVCIPASTQLDTERRYAIFSQKVCEATGMNNAFLHLKVVKDGESRHEGGEVKHELWHDEEFFLGKAIVLFDDVRRSGMSIKREAEALSKLGAVVICSLSLGQRFLTPVVVSKRLTEPNVENMHECVDLGLSVKWATCNIGAKSPQDYGEYYRWGERVGCEYNSMNFLYKQPEDLLIKGIIDDDWHLTPQYDIATQKWGGRWRMPTHCEKEELDRFCKKEWVTIDGIPGCKFTGPNGNHIFLPSCGTSLNRTRLCTFGMYWASTACPVFYTVGVDDTGRASALLIHDPRNPFIFETPIRIHTYCVRPVIDL